MTVTSRLRSLLAGPPFIVADCYSALTARIVEHVGFQAAYMGGHATGMMHHAIPDHGVFTPTEMIDHAARVTEAVGIPVIVDADQAGESVADVRRSIRLYERAGVAGVHLEDEIPPKHSSWDGPLLAVEDMSARIRTAVEARTDADFVIIARSDELYSVGGGGTGALDEAVRRGVAYAAAGADVFLPTFATAEQVAVLTSEVPIPIAGYGTQLLPGLSFALATGWGVASAARIHRQWAITLLEEGDLPAHAYEFPDKASAIRQDEFDAVVERWAVATGRPLRPLPDPSEE